jgi:hypothetical protein
MLRHLTPAGTGRLSEIDCRQPASECPPEIVFAASKPFRQTGMAVLIRNLCALTIGQAGVAERSTRRVLDHSAILRHKTKYGEGVLYARARSVVMRRNLPAVTSEAYGEYSYNYTVV